MNNIVFIPVVGTNPEYQYSIASWQKFCEKYGHTLFTLTDAVSNVNVRWHKYFLFDILDANEITCDQALIVDADTLVQPRCPDLFTMTENKYALVHDDGDYGKTIRQMEDYKKRMFSNLPLFDWFKYYNNGLQIVNKGHRAFFDEMKQFVLDHQDEQSDQTTLNFLIRKNNVQIKELSIRYNLGYLHKKEILNESMLQFGDVLHFNGLKEVGLSVHDYMKFIHERIK